MTFFKNVKTNAFIGLVLVFTIDLFIPLGVAVGVLYICCLSLLLREKMKTILIFSITASLLTVLAFLLHFHIDVSWMVYANRIIAISSIWIVGYIAFRHKKLDDIINVHVNELKEKNKELEQFTYIASHDLQEPLRTITSFSNLFKKKYYNQIDKTSDKYLDFISHASIRMSQLVKSLLDYNRIGRKKEKVHFDCNVILESVLDDLSNSIEKTNTQFSVEKLPKIDGYETDIRLLFQNLISNGIKFNSSKPPIINIKAKKNEDYWQFSFTDNGIGIEEAYMDKIFLIFQRLHKKEEYEGTGIGLAHCKKIVDLHKGDIWVESKPNKGSTFHFTIKN